MTALILLSLFLVGWRVRYVRTHPACGLCARRYRRGDGRVAQFWLTPLHRSWVCVWCQRGGLLP